MRKRLLIIAYHYPPIHRSSGVHRTVNFARYLPGFDWDPCVLTVHSRAYLEKSDSGAALAPAVPVHRAFALDTSRHLSIGGRYLNLMSVPDRWVSWWLGAVPAGLKLIKRYKPDVIFSTYPIATAHLVALTLHRLTGIPWVADFRDPMTDAGYPTDPTVRKAYLWIERKTINACAHAVFTTPDSRQMYLDRFPELHQSSSTVITNGYDEEAFLLARQNRPPDPGGPAAGPLVLVHSGTLYRSERNPEPFFSALAELANEGHISAKRIKIILRASGEEKHFRARLEQLGIDRIVYLESPVTYTAAIEEMLAADGLLLFQAANCNHQIPAKAYEYIRARRPVLTLTDPDGNTAALMREAGLHCITRINSKDDIKEALQDFIYRIDHGNSHLPTTETIQRYSRKHKTEELAAVLDKITDR